MARRALVLLALALAAPRAAAQPGGFQSTAELYLMGASMSGTVGVGPVATDIDVPASTIFEHLKFAVLGDYRGQAERWAVAADVVYMNLGAAGTGQGGRVSVDVGVEEFIFDLVGAYRVSRRLEILAGGRVTALRTTIDLTGPTSSRYGEGSKSWFDPVVGAQAFLPLGKGFEAQMRGDVGGFGVGCDFTWQATVRVNWQSAKGLRAGVGYRWLDQDYESGSGSDFFKWKVLSQGPLLVAGYRF